MTTKNNVPGLFMRCGGCNAVAVVAGIEPHWFRDPDTLVTRLRERGWFLAFIVGPDGKSAYDPVCAACAAAILSAPGRKAWPT